VFTGAIDKVQQHAAALDVTEKAVAETGAFVGAFVGEKKSFRKPVLVDLGESGLKTIGFVTAEALGIESVPDHVAVYLPQAYNIAGNLILVPRSAVTALPPNESSKWLAFVVSGGVSRGTEPPRPAS